MSSRVETRGKRHRLRQVTHRHRRELTAFVGSFVVTTIVLGAGTAIALGSRPRTSAPQGVLVEATTILATMPVEERSFEVAPHLPSLMSLQSAFHPSALVTDEQTERASLADTCATPSRRAWRRPAVSHRLTRRSAATSRIASAAIGQGRRSITTRRPMRAVARSEDHSLGALAFDREELRRPEILTAGQIALGMRRVARLVRNCAGPDASGPVLVDVMISGATGSPADVRVRGSIGSSSAGRCVTRAVRRARFPRFNRTSLEVRHPFVVR